MSAPYVCVVHLPMSTGVTADEAQNTWAFTAPGAVVADDLAAIEAAMQTFYRAIQGYLSPALGTAPYMKIYSAVNALELSPPLDVLGAPLVIHPFTWSGGFSGTQQIEEASIALSFHGDYGTAAEFVGKTRPRARHRGRVYLGPLNTSSVSVDSGTHHTKVADAVLTAVAGAAATLRSASGCTWSIWSRTNKAFYTVTAGWVDNAFDTQRRRGPAALGRTTF